MTAGRLLADAALKAGLYSQSYPEFGPERSGAPVRAYVRISDEPVTLRAPIESFDAATIFEERLLDPTIVDSIKSGGYIVLNSENVPRLTRSDVKVFVVRARQIIEELRKPRSLNLAMLGALSSVLEVVPHHYVEEAIRRRFGEENAEVVRRASQMVVRLETAV